MRMLLGENNAVEEKEAKMKEVKRNCKKLTKHSFHFMSSLGRKHCKRALSRRTRQVFFWHMLLFLMLLEYKSKHRDVWLSVLALGHATSEMSARWNPWCELSERP